MEVRGIEPLTSGLQSPRSAKLSYAPTALIGRDCFLKVMGLSRFELLTSRLSGVRSNQLSYRPLISVLPQNKATWSNESSGFSGSAKSVAAIGNSRRRDAAKELCSNNSSKET